MSAKIKPKRLMLIDEITKIVERLSDDGLNRVFGYAEEVLGHMERQTSPAVVYQLPVMGKKRGAA